MWTPLLPFARHSFYLVMRYAGPGIFWVYYHMVSALFIPRAGCIWDACLFPKKANVNSAGDNSAHEFIRSPLGNYLSASPLQHQSPESMRCGMQAGCKLLTKFFVSSQAVTALPSVSRNHDVCDNVWHGYPFLTTSSPLQLPRLPTHTCVQNFK